MSMSYHDDPTFAGLEHPPLTPLMPSEQDPRDSVTAPTTLPSLPAPPLSSKFAIELGPEVPLFDLRIKLQVRGPI